MGTLEVVRDVMAAVVFMMWKTPFDHYDHYYETSIV